MDLQELVQKILDSAKIPELRRKLQFGEDSVVAEILGDYCSGRLIVQKFDDFCWVQVRAPGVLVKIWAPLEMLQEGLLFDEVVDAVEASRDWEPVVIDWSVLAEELEDAVVQELC